MTAIITSTPPTTEMGDRGLTMPMTSAARAELRRAVHGLEDSLLLQTVSHDLRSPISAVLALTGMLISDTQGTACLSVEMRLALMAKVELSMRQMDRLLTDVLDSDPMRQVSDGHHSCDIGEMVRRLLDEIGLEYDHPLEIDLACTRVHVNAIHVERIVDNLLRNAGKHVAPGVPIWVRTAALDGGVLISVEDAGSGVDPKVAKTIFEPFQRGDGVQSEGHGLGLSLVYRFAALHGGSAWVEERAGGGASFRVFLPSESGPINPRSATVGNARFSPTGKGTSELVPAVRSVEGRADGRLTRRSGTGADDPPAGGHHGLDG